MPSPVIAVVGYSNTGKTRVTSSLISYLSGYGYRVASVKHCHEGHDIDRANSDTYHHREAGAAVVISQFSRSVDTHGIRRRRFLSRSNPSDYKRGHRHRNRRGIQKSSVPKVLVVGSESYYPEVENVIAVVSDGPCDRDIPIYGFDQLSMLASQIRCVLVDVERPTEPITLVVDGEALTPEHGYPLRLLVPGWYGMASVKWLRSIKVIDYTFKGFHQTEYYVFTNEGVADGSPRERVTSMQVKSFIMSVRRGQSLETGTHQIQGVA